MNDSQNPALERIQNFEEFWPFYVGEHRKPLCRGLHYLGSSAALLLIVASLFHFSFLWLPVILVVGYGPAWVAHFFVEGNKPASFAYPGWSLRADFKMLLFALQGKMADEVMRLHGSVSPPADTRLRSAQR